jgi:hypothetical protein
MEVFIAQHSSTPSLQCLIIGESKQEKWALLLFGYHLHLQKTFGLRRQRVGNFALRAEPLFV